MKKLEAYIKQEGGNILLQKVQKLVLSFYMMNMMKS